MRKSKLKSRIKALECLVDGLCEYVGFDPVIRQEVDMQPLATTQDPDRSVVTVRGVEHPLPSFDEVSEFRECTWLGPAEVIVKSTWGADSSDLNTELPPDPDPLQEAPWSGAAEVILESREN